MTPDFEQKARELAPCSETFCSSVNGLYVYHANLCAVHLRPAIAQALREMYEAGGAAVREGYSKDWCALYKAIGLPEETTNAKIISNRVMEMRAAAGLAIDLAEYLFQTDCSDFDRYQWLKAECVRRCPAFFSLDGDNLKSSTPLNPTQGA